MPKFLLLLAMSLSLLLRAVPVQAQVEDLLLTVESDAIGLNGVVRPGSWAPILLTLENRSAEPRKVRCEVVVPDFDGDRVYAQRVVTLTPERTQRVWLYAMPPINTPARPEWRVQVLADETDRLLAWAPLKIAGDALLDRAIRVIGVIGTAPLGLQAYEENYTQHESCRFIRGMQAALLPDRWYGLAMLQALIWTPEGGDPNDAAIPPDSLRALRQWVQRGGHLVVVLPAIGDDWTASPLTDMLPPVTLTTQTDVPPPPWLGNIQSDRLINIDVKTLQPRSQEVVVLLRDQHGPLVVAHQYGFGRVTLVGVDLSERRLLQMGLPGPGQLTWRAVFGWRSPALDKDFIRGEIQQGRMSQPGMRKDLELGEFMPPLIAMRTAAGPALLAAIVLFLVYLLVAGVVLLPVLRRRKLERHTWLAFAAVVLLFSALSWGGALVLRPTSTAAEHFTILDGDASTGLVHAHSWLSLFVPTHGPVEVVLGRRGEGNFNTLAAPGLGLGRMASDEGTFLDPQRYRVQAAAPYQARLPFRSTAKQLELDYLGPPLGHGTSTPWIMPQGTVRIGSDNWPVGKLSHGLPGPLLYVTYIYYDGAAREPMYWDDPRPWPPGEIRELGGTPRGATMLVERTNPPWRGRLGELIDTNKAGQRLGADEQPAMTPEDKDIREAVEMLTFFSTLPPPDYQRVELMNPATMYTRVIGRELDLAALMRLRRLIVIGYLKNSELPVPLTVDGRIPPARGWTVVRWITPLE